jgi:tRNA (cmo5U34)-methyltransferase
MEDKIDSLFLKKAIPGSFLFDKTVVEVFDNMVERSVPFYSHLLKIIALLSREFYTSGTNIIDLGCSTGNIIKELEYLEFDFKYKGVDSSLEMIKKARSNYKEKINLEFLHKDLISYDFPVSSVSIANLTLQFISPEDRQMILKKVYTSLQRGGAFIMVEKVIEEQEEDIELFRKVHHQFKEEQGYSKLEIANKRDALLNVLTPLTLNQNKNLIYESGFSRCSVFFKWFNFTGFIAFK